MLFTLNYLPKIKNPTKPYGCALTTCLLLNQPVINDSRGNQKGD